jgi:hypothetical protein
MKKQNSSCVAAFTYSLFPAHALPMMIPQFIIGSYVSAVIEKLTVAGLSSRALK